MCRALVCRAGCVGVPSLRWCAVRWDLIWPAPVCSVSDYCSANILETRKRYIFPWFFWWCCLYLDSTSSHIWQCLFVCLFPLLILVDLLFPFRSGLSMPAGENQCSPVSVVLLLRAGAPRPTPDALYRIYTLLQRFQT